MPSARWVCEVYSAPAYTSSVSDISRQNSSYTPRITNNLGVNLSLGIKNWHVQSGLSYNFLDEKLEYKNEYLSFVIKKNYDVYLSGGEFRVDTVDSYYVAVGTDTSWHYATTSTWIPIYDSILVTKVDTVLNIEKKKSINKYHYWEIPVVVGYSFIRKKLTINTRAGVIFGFFSDVKGKYALSDNSKILTDFKNSDFASVAYSFYSSLAVNYQFHKRFYAIFEPNYRWNINSILSRTSSFNQRYHSYSLKLGLGVKL